MELAVREKWFAALHVRFALLRLFVHLFESFVFISAH